MNIFKSIKELLYVNSKTIPLEGELLKSAQELYEVKDGNWTPAQKNAFSEDLKAFEKDGTAATPEKKAFFEAVAKSQEPDEQSDEEQSDEKQPELGADGKEKVYRYRVKTDCTFKRKYRRVGDIVFSAVKLKVPHFEAIAEEEVSGGE